MEFQAIDDLVDHLPLGEKYDTMKAYAEGTWAPAIRFHKGEFYLYVCTPFDGLFMWHTKDPAGKWSEVVTVKAISSGSFGRHGAIRPSKKRRG